MTTLEILLCIALIISIILSLIINSNKNEYKRLYNKLELDVKQDEEDRNSGRITIPVTFGGICKYVYSDATPKEFAKQFGAPWKTETHNNVLGIKSLCLTYCEHYALNTEFMNVWFNENYRLDSIHTNN